ncbi:molybdopterin molybdotransferase MoeA [Qipengyuania atrilutea]|uniref:Molybdopterin molybdenumtransferase n=1 Tax=Qipengyuania atrilutea TaxID=2744473 RepID=A0A850H9W9_9SPHN|nr:gephyrin-like molybdotransferase Glp [Actirhodobacter atriluteus]NVD43869.1 molybdopterin molybdotransferase MoeA [Actirhodobacter atriluteus]
MTGGLLSYEDAVEALLAMAKRLPAENVPLDDAAGRFLLEPLTARRTQPATDVSAMDGYAVADPSCSSWQVVGESRAGRSFTGRLSGSEATRISTGAALPDGATAVILQENIARDGKTIALTEESGGEAEGQHIRRRGQDFAEGDVLVEAGERVTARTIGLAASAGHSRLAVALRPRVAILQSGSELSADFENCPDDRLPASNGPMLAELARSAGADVSLLPVVPDNETAIGGALSSAAEDHDVLVTIGGASVGDHDLIQPALRPLGADIQFWKVAIKPGKPLFAARLNNCTILGLPGNPASAFVTACLFLEPMLRSMTGCVRPLPRFVTLPLAAAITQGGTRREFLRARLTNYGVMPIGGQDSSLLAALAHADCLIERPAHAEPAKAGKLAQCLLLGTGGTA